jgi:hypothetical protein
MNAHWRVRRVVSAQDAGQQRWDLAYQCLLRWMEGDGADGAGRRPADDAKERQHGCRPVCAGIDPTAAPDPDHCVQTISIGQRIPLSHTSVSRGVSAGALLR